MDVTDIEKKITPVLREYGVQYAGIFGSFARGEDTPESDVDLLVSMGRRVGVYTFMELQHKLAQALGRDVDLVSKNAINKHLEPYIMRDLTTVYEER